MKKVHFILLLVTVSFVGCSKQINSSSSGGYQIKSKNNSTTQVEVSPSDNGSFTTLKTDSKHS